MDGFERSSGENLGDPRGHAGQSPVEIKNGDPTGGIGRLEWGGGGREWGGRQQERALLQDKELIPLKDPIRCRREKAPEGQGKGPQGFKGKGHWGDRSEKVPSE